MTDHAAKLAYEMASEGLRRQADDLRIIRNHSNTIAASATGFIVGVVDPDFGDAPLALQTLAVILTAIAVGLWVQLIRGQQWQGAPNVEKVLSAHDPDATETNVYRRWAASKQKAYRVNKANLKHLWGLHNGFIVVAILVVLSWHLVAQ